MIWLLMYDLCLLPKTHLVYIVQKLSYLDVNCFLQSCKQMCLYLYRITIGELINCLQATANEKQLSLFLDFFSSCLQSQLSIITTVYGAIGFLTVQWCALLVTGTKVGQKQKKSLFLFQQSSEMHLCIFTVCNIYSYKILPGFEIDDKTEGLFVQFNIYIFKDLLTVKTVYKQCTHKKLYTR